MDQEDARGPTTDLPLITRAWGTFLRSCLCRFTDEPVAEIVHCGEPISEGFIPVTWVTFYSRAVHAFVPAVLLRLAGLNPFDPFDLDPQTEPADGELAEPIECAVGDANGTPLSV
jgi:hypothetical protein